MFRSSPVPGTDLTQHYRESRRALHAPVGVDQQPLVPEELAECYAGLNRGLEKGRAELAEGLPSRPA